jgi:hypothetical protein
MAVELTNDELAKVGTTRKAERPNYFNAELSAEITISEDFEAFLILQEPATLSSTLAVIPLVGLLYTNDLAKTGVMLEFLITDEEDRSNQQSEIESLTDAFNTWKGLFEGGKFSDVSEVGLVIRDIQATAGPVFLYEDRMLHLENVHIREAARLRQGVSDAQLRELQSWPTPILAYL